MRNVEEVFSALKENLDQILGNLQDGILLFTGTAGRCWCQRRHGAFCMWRRTASSACMRTRFSTGSTALGQALREAFDAGATVTKQEIRTETGRRFQASLDFIHDDRTGQGLGALVTLHDLESVERIESELELSRRMAAIGRLTSGVGHEVKNPINAIVVHLELLKTKLGDANAPAARHLEVIDAEIHRLDRVVQMLVDFSRPVDLQLREQDLRAVIGDVLALAAEELSTRNVTLVSQHARRPSGGQRGCGSAEAGGAQRDPERRPGHAGGRKTGSHAGRRQRERSCCASATRDPASRKRSGRRSSTSTSPRGARAAASAWP